ncbi:MAG: DUF393 domain-containing protein [Bacteroidetes bacterium]|nr:DUF393 domain-containing protein [Bacteroidota bacterium]
MKSATAPVLYFDGLCNLCNGAVQYIIRHDKQRLFRFASLQSEAGRQVQEVYRKQYGQVPDSLILQVNDKIYSRSDAALRTAILIKRWKWLSKMCLVIPKFLRDGVYNLIARNRYRWFGKKESCMIPTPELQSRFLS